MAGEVLSRREFFKKIGGVSGVLFIDGLGVAAAYFLLRRSRAAAAVASMLFSPSSQPANKGEPYTPGFVFTGEIRTFDGEDAKTVTGIEKEFAVKIISPITWDDDNGQIQANSAWTSEEIALLAKSMRQLPPEYRSSSRSPKEIILFKGSGPDSDNEGVGGGYINRSVLFFISAAFGPDRDFRGEVAGKVFGKQGDNMRANVTHEYTHSFIEAHPELLDDWVQQMGWKQEGSSVWSNSKPQNLLSVDRADDNPVEDIAVSAGLMLVNPAALSKDRINFFLTNKHYADWPVVTSYKKNYS